MCTQPLLKRLTYKVILLGLIFGGASCNSRPFAPDPKECFKFFFDMPASQISNLHGEFNALDGCTVGTLEFTSEKFPSLKNQEFYHDMDCFKEDLSGVSEVFREEPKLEEERKLWRAQLQCKHADTEIQNGTKLFADYTIIYDPQKQNVTFITNG